MSTPTVVTPTLYWSQTANAIQIKIDIKEADKSTIKVKVNMDGSGTTMGGKNVVIQAKSKSNPDCLYQLNLDLYSDVLPSISPEVFSHSILVTLAKIHNETTPSDPKRWWPHLLADPSLVNKNKIKIDWDRWHDEGENEDAADEEAKAAERASLKEQFNALKSRKEKLASGMGGIDCGGDDDDFIERNPLSAAFRLTDNPQLAAIPRRIRLKISYLFAYNFLILTGIGLILFLALQNCYLHYHPQTIQNRIGMTGTIHDHHDGGLANAFFHGFGSLHRRIGGIAYFVQFLASLEILHSAVGLIQGNVLSSFLLNGGRDIILFGCIASFPTTHTDYSVGALYFIWALGDFIRYLYYIIQLVQSSPEATIIGKSWFSVGIMEVCTNETVRKRILLCRQILPLVLLPFGFATELKVVYSALDEASMIPLFGSQWSVATLLKAYCVPAYLLGAPFIYLYMYKAATKKKSSKPRVTRRRSSGKATTPTSEKISSATASSVNNTQSKKEN